jgi:chromosome segregation ATPase
MTNIVARIEAHLQNDDAGQRWLDSDNLLEEAQAEIERLHAKDQHWNAHLRTAQAEIKRLTACLKWEQNWLERVGTHSPGCWQWGPGHYLCAIRHIEEMERD